MVKKLFLNLIVLSLLVGCGPKTPPAPTSFSIFFNQRETAPYNADWLILQEYQKQQNVIFDVSIGDDSDYGRAITQTFESGNIPDIVLKIWPDTVESYAASGVLLPFSDYEDLMPNFVAYIEAHDLQAELDKLRMANGKYYILPGYQREIQVQQWIYRRDAFEQNNLETPTTYDELFDALVTLKGIYPDSTPITAIWGGAHLFAMMGANYGIPAGWNGTSHYNANTDTWQYSPAMENYHEMLRFLNRCYAAGILDPSFFTQPDEEFQAKIEGGQALVSVTWISSGLDSWNDKLAANGVPGGNWEPLPVMESTNGIRFLPAVNPFRKGLVVPTRVINEPYLEALIKFLDWAVYSEEGMTLTSWGVEGITYEKTNTGYAFLPDIQTSKNPEGTINIEKTYGLNLIFDLNENEAYEDYKKPADIVAFLQRSLDNNETAELKPLLVLNPNALEAIRIIDEKLVPYVDETRTAFIKGDLNIDNDWEEYVSQLETRGYLTLQEIWNTSWAAQNK